jgi:hypothetical protein
MTSRWYGTRIVTLPCINGIVICADKSLNDLNGMVLTNRIKIHQLGRKAAFSMTGLARANALDPTLAPVWDPVKTIEDFFADKNPLHRPAQGTAC